MSRRKISKLDEIWEEERYYTKEVSQRARPIALGMLLICWLFKSTSNVMFPTPIYWSFLFVVIFFLFDILEYYVGAVAHRNIGRMHEKKLRKEGRIILGIDEIEKPSSYDSTINALWYLKLIFLFFSFVALTFEIVARII